MISFESERKEMENFAGKDVDREREREREIEQVKRAMNISL